MDYWDKDEHGNQLPYLDNVQFRFMKEQSQQLLEFRNGKLDECYQIPLESFKEVVNENKNLTPEYSKFILQRTPSLTIQYYGFLVTNDLFKDVRIRKAFNYAIDRNKIIRFVLNGQAAGGAFYGIVPPAMPDYNSKMINGYEYDIKKAKDLMKEAGYPDGRGFPEVTLQINEGGGRNIQIAEAIQSMLKSIGVTVKLQILTFAQHLDNIDAGRADFYRLGWIADYPDPENFLNLYYGKNVPDNPKDISPINSTRYANEEYDNIYEKAIETLDKTERYKLYLKAEQIAVLEAPMLYIFYSEDYRLLQPFVKGYTLDPMHRVNFRFLWLDK
jgi:peptide/nickel transport system substrate-binding protein